MIQLYHQIIHYDLGRSCYKMSISEKSKAMNNKIEQNKAQYNLERQTANISTLSSENVNEYKFLTGKDVLPEKDLLEKAAAIKIFEYSPLGKDLKEQTGAAKKEYQKLHKVFDSTVPNFVEVNN